MTSTRLCLFLVFVFFAALSGGCDGVDPDGGVDGDVDGGPDSDVTPDPEDTWLVHLGSGRCRRYGNGIVETDDGGVILAGFYNDEESEAGVWMVGLDSDQEMIWEMLLGEGDEWVNDAAPHPEGGIVMVGHSSGEGWLASVDVDGTPRWQWIFRTGGPAAIHSVAATEDGGLLLSGLIQSRTSPSFDLWAARADSEGRLQWQRRFPGLDIQYTALAATSDGGAIVAGQGPDGDLEWTWIVRLDPSGAPLWQRQIMAANGSMNRRFGIVETSDGDITVIMSRSGVTVVRLDSEGDLRWARAVSGGDVRSDVIVAGPEGGVVISGTETSFTAFPYNLWTFGLDAAGEILWQWTVPDEPVGEAHDAVVTRDGGAMVISGGCADTWILKLASDGSFGDACAMLEATSAIMIDEDVSIRDASNDSEETSDEPESSTPSIHDSSSTAEVFCRGQGE